MIRMKRLKNGEIAEETIHKIVMEWASINPVTKPYHSLFLHYPNSGKRTLHYGKLLKDMGMRKGVVDLFIAVPRRGFGGAWIELKSENGVLGPEQKLFLEQVATQNFYAAVCWSIDQAIETISWYFGSEAE